MVLILALDYGMGVVDLSRNAYQVLEKGTRVPAGCVAAETGAAMSRISTPTRGLTILHRTVRALVHSQRRKDELPAVELP